MPQCRERNHAGRAVRLLLTLLLVLGLVRPAVGQPLLYASGGSGVVGGQSHGWIAVPSMNGTALVHVPPRKPGVTKAALDGTMRQARELKVPPIAIAAVGDRVFLISDVPATAGTPGRRSVESLRAMPSAVGDLWYFEPDGHLRELPDLPAYGAVDGFVGTDPGPLALVDGQLLLLDDRGWNRIDPPSPLVGRGWDSLSRLIEIGGRPAILSPRADGAIEVWIGQITATGTDRPPARSKRRGREPRDGTTGGGATDDSLEPPAPYSVLWSSETYASDGSLTKRGLSGPWIGEVGGVITYAAGMSDGSVAIGTITRQSSYELAVVRGVGPIFGVVPIEDGARIALAWLERESTPSGSESRVQRRVFPAPGEPSAEPKSGAVRARGHLEIRELSVFTGAVLYSGPQRGDGPVSAFEVQVLAGALVLVMVVVLILVLSREPDDGVFHLPRGTAMAEPGRRAMAAVMDLGAAILIADKLWGVPITDLLGPNRIFSGEALWVLGSAVLIGLVLGTVGEWLTGRSFGKAMMGCAVVDARTPGGEPRAPKLWQALVRNLVKWIASPAAMLGLMESAGRHRGDALSRTLVCVSNSDDEDEADDSQDDARA